MSSKQHLPPQKQDSASRPTLWEFVRLADYRVPSAAVASAALEKWASVKRIFRNDGSAEQAPVKAEAELRALSQSRLQRLVGPVDWRCAAAALEVALADWLQIRKADAPVKFVIGQPHCGHPEILAHWAARHRAIPVEAPSAEQILDGDTRWLENWPRTDRPWVLPNLEHCYLRHANGLGLVRRLLEKTASGALGRGVIACDSWAWAYLQEVWPIPQPEALTLQAFDGLRLSRYLAELASCQGGGCLRFRNATTGKEVQLQRGPDDSEACPELNHIAVHSRGNIGSARSSWRASLRATPEQDDDALQRAAKLAQDSNPDAEVVWVSAAAQEPVMPAEKGEGMAFVLHALLLHNGLPASLLPTLLPQPDHRLASCLLQLQTQGVVTLAGERWQISVSAYAVVRDFLRRRGFMSDDF